MISKRNDEKKKIVVVEILCISLLQYLPLQFILEGTLNVTIDCFVFHMILWRTVSPKLNSAVRRGIVDYEISFGSVWAIISWELVAFNSDYHSAKIVITALCKYFCTHDEYRIRVLYKCKAVVTSSHLSRNKSDFNTKK